MNSIVIEINYAVKLEDLKVIKSYSISPDCANVVKKLADTLTAGGITGQISESAIIEYLIRREFKMDLSKSTIQNIETK